MIVPDAVIAEVAFILTSPRHYDLPREVAKDALLPLLVLPGCVLADREACVAALQWWAREPGISFVDALAATIAFDADGALATFDRRLQRLTDARVWQPCVVDGS